MFFLSATVPSHSLGAHETGGRWFGTGVGCGWGRLYKTKTPRIREEFLKTWLQVKTCPSWALFIPLDLHRDFPFPTFYINSPQLPDFVRRGFWTLRSSTVTVASLMSRKKCVSWSFLEEFINKIILILSDINTFVSSPQLVNCKRHGTFLGRLWEVGERGSKFFLFSSFLPPCPPSLLYVLFVALFFSTSQSCWLETSAKWDLHIIL